MLHYSCDICKRPIIAGTDVRHVLKIEVFPAVEDQCCGQVAQPQDRAVQRADQRCQLLLGHVLQLPHDHLLDLVPRHRVSATVLSGPGAAKSA